MASIRKGPLKRARNCESIGEITMIVGTKSQVNRIFNVQGGRNNVLTIDDFRQQLSSLIKSDTVAVRMKCTPDMAAVMMERNESEEWKNRPKSERNLQRMKRAMLEGRWAYTGQPVIFSKTGRLLNGQHTLTSAIQSGCEIDILVAFNVPDESFKYMDIGAKRGADQILAIEGVPNASLMSSMGRILIIYTENPRWAGDTSNYDIDPDEILEFYQRHPDMQQSRAAAVRFNSTKLLPPSWAGALHYICAKRDRQEADEFFNKLATGVGINSVDEPVFVIRKRLERIKAGATREPIRNLGAYVVKAWNAQRDGQTIQVLRWRTGGSPNEIFPRAK